MRRASASERKIHDLSVNMRMKEDLIKALNKTGMLIKLCISAHIVKCWLEIWWISVSQVGQNIPATGMNFLQLQKALLGIQELD